MTRRAGGAMIGIGVIGCLGVLAHQHVPNVVDWKLRRELASRGFPEARFRVVAADLDRIELADVELGPGLALGAVEIDGGLSLLWSDPASISIRGARIRGEALARLNGTGGDLPLRELRITDSVLELDGGVLSVAGTVELDGRPMPALIATARTWRVADRELQDLRIQVDGSRVCGWARLDDGKVHACVALPRHWSSQSEVRDGHAEVHLPAWSRDRIAIDDTVIGLDFAGSLDAIRGHGELRARSGRVGSVVLDDVEATFEVVATGSPRSLRVQPSSLHARELSVRDPDVAVRATGVTATPAVTIDVGTAGFAISARPFTVTARELHATAGARSVDATDVRADLAAGDTDRVTSLRWPDTSTREHREPLTLTVKAASLLASIDDHRVSATTATIRLPLGDVVGTRGGDRAFEVGRIEPRLGDVGWSAGGVRIGGAVLLEPRGTITRARVIAWQARELAVRGVTVRAPSGTVNDSGVRWRADELVAGEASVHSLSGTIARDGTIEWLAEKAGWRDASAMHLAGRVATSGDAELHAETLRWRDAEMSGPTMTLSNGVAMWSALSVTRGSLALQDVAGTSTLDAGTHLVSWSSARTGKLAFGSGIVTLTSLGEQVSIARGSVTAYGGSITLVRTTPLAAALVLDVRGVRLDAILGAFSSRARGTGSLDGTLVVRDGELERVDLASRARGTFQIGDRSWVDQAVASLAAGHVAVTERIGGALADFAFTRLAVVLASTTAGPTLRVTVHGTGRRVSQELDLVLNVRGLREAALVFARAREAS